jgi:cation:H+ antiporter
MMLLMGGASHVLVEAAIHLGDLAGIDAVIMGFVVIAAGTSVPDTVLSVISAKKGQYDAAISNVFGSNIFDICICLSFPILIALAMGGGPTPIVLPQIELIGSLIAATLVAFYFFRSGYELSKPESIILLGIYFLIVILSFTF